MLECARCGGSGKIKKFKHVEGGVCFDCNGTGRNKVPQGQILITFLSGNREVLAERLFSGSASKKEVMAYGREVGAISMKMVKSG